MKKLLFSFVALCLVTITFAQPDDVKTMHENAKAAMRSGDSMCDSH